MKEMKHQRPSALASLSQCRRFTPDDAGSKYAEAGTLFHDDLQHIIETSNPADYESAAAALVKRSDDHREMVKEALRQAAPFLSLGLPVKSDAKFTYDQAIESMEPGVYLEASIQLWPDSDKVGRIDCLVVMSPGVAVVIDWKSNTQDADFSWQLGSYATALARLCGTPWKSITCKIVAPNLELHEDVIYDAQALKDTEDAIRKLEDEVDDPFTPPCPGEHCKYCRCMRLLQCPATATCAVSRLPVEYTDEVKRVLSSPKILLHPTTLEERALRRDWLTVATMLAEHIKEDDKLYFLVHTQDSLPGYKVSTRLGNRQLDKSMLRELNEDLMRAFGFSEADMMSCLEPNRELLVEKGALKLGSRNKAEAQYAEVVDAYSVRGASIVTVRRDASRKLEKPKKQQ